MSSSATSVFASLTKAALTRSARLIIAILGFYCSCPTQSPSNGQTGELQGLPPRAFRQIELQVVDPCGNCVRGTHHRLRGEAREHRDRGPRMRATSRLLGLVGVLSTGGATRMFL